MVQQYLAVKEQHKNELLFFRLGDFYEMFFEDALTASRELNITLTKRAGNGDNIPMCGVPYHSVDGYIAKLVQKGYRIAICEQMEDPRFAKGIVERKVIKIITPGTALNEVERICEEIDEVVTITLGQRHILFEVGETELICRRLEGEFLDYKNAIPRRNPINVVVDTKTMLQSLERVSVVISEKLKSPVRCQFGEDKVTMSAKTANCDAKDVCRIAGDGQGLEIGFNNRYLMDALRYAPADTVRMELNTGISPAIIVPVEGEENFLYMVLPVRLKAN